MIYKGQRVRVEFSEFDVEGTVLHDCKDWLCDELVIRDDFDGRVYNLATHLAHDVQIIPPEIVDTGVEHNAHMIDMIAVTVKAVAPFLMANKLAEVNSGQKVT